jgi:hypothetical protein
MRLTELKPQFLKREDSHHFALVDSFAQADGVEFLCPRCFRDNGGAVGTHAIICWSPSVPQDTYPRPGRWEMRGTGVADLTLHAGSSSVMLTTGCRAHFFVRDGEIVDC